MYDPHLDEITKIERCDIHRARLLVARLRAQGKHAYTELTGNVRATLDGECPVWVLVKTLRIPDAAD